MKGAIACAALEIRRGRSVLVSAAAGAAVIAALNTAHRFEADHPLAILLIVLPGMAALAMGLHPMATLAGDRLSGRLALERALPLPWHVTAAARLAGAAVRTLATPLILVAVLVGVMRHADFAPPWAVGLTIIAGAWMVVSMLCWLLMAANARWSLIRLWWVPTTLWLAPQWMPDAWFDRAMQALRPIGQWIVAEAASARGPFRLLLPLAIAFLVTWVAAAFLYASGLRRYVHDPDPLGLIGKRDRVTAALEYPPGRRSALPALALLDIRLGVELLAKRWIILAALVVVTIVGPAELRKMAPLYIRILGVMVPGAVVAGIITSRQSGAIALLQHLPHPHWVVATGKLAAVLVLSVLGVGVVSVARLLDGPAGVPSGVELVRPIVVMAGLVWVTAVFAMWWRRRHLYWLLAIVLAVGGGMTAFGITAAPVIIGTMELLRSPLAAFFAFAMVALAGIPLFAHGLARYSKS
ncbi:MAG: hypothetical protein H0W15_09495 [Gemmatimonadales bacterium]|nr:hypothetical protein [Gemmatimonadales bacterium]